jgi:hypothetical protein
MKKRDDSNEYELTSRSNQTLEEVILDADFDRLVQDKPRGYGLKDCHWVLLVLSASVCFATCNIFMADLAS